MLFSRPGRPGVLIFLFLIFKVPSVFAAACCGGGFVAPAIISSDDRAQLTTAYSTTQVVVDNVDAQGVWRTWDHHQQVQTLRLSGAHILDDRWQVGFDLPLIRRSRLEQSYTGLGDTSLVLGYEYLPDWNYHPVRPKGIGFLHGIIPTGKAKAESMVGGMDSRGNGFWAIGLGTLLTKSYRSFDAFILGEIHQSLSKRVDSGQVKGRILPGTGWNGGIGLGYNFRSLRFGSSLTWAYEEPIRLRGNFHSDGSFERSTAANLSASYLASNTWSGTVSYSDQTWFGAPINTSLGRSIALQIQRKWGR